MCGVRGQCGGVDSLPLPLGFWDCQAVELLAEPLPAEYFFWFPDTVFFSLTLCICVGGWVSMHTQM